MTTNVAEIGPGIYRLSTFAPAVGPTGFTFNQFLLDDDEPLLFHTGHRSMLPSVREAIERVMPVERLRWISFGHIESDECGAMNELLSIAPDAEVAHGGLGCAVSLNEMADRPPRAFADGEVQVIGSFRLRHFDTPHVPHAWEARLLFEETTATLLCGDLFTQLGDRRALTDGDILGASEVAEDLFGYSNLTPTTVATIERLADLEPKTLAAMHGSSFTGDGGGALRALAASYARRIRAASAHDHDHEEGSQQ